MTQPLFTITSSTGQIRTRLALNTMRRFADPADTELDGWAPGEHAPTQVRVKVEDGGGGSVSKDSDHHASADEAEPPSAPSAPRVTATEDTGWSLDVTWNEPRDTGKPPITDYDIQYRKFKSGTPKDAWELWPHGTDDAEGNTDRKAEIEQESSRP